MNRGLLEGIKASPFIPRWMGGGDPANDGGLLVADSTQEGSAKIATRRTAIGATPTIVLGSASTSVSVVGHDEAHQVLLTTAASLAPDVVVATVTFSSPWPGLTVPCFSCEPKNGASAAAQPYVTTDSATSYQIFLHNPPALATAMIFDILVMGR